MRIKEILLIVLIVITGLLGILLGEEHISENGDSREVEVLEVIDGDTIKVKDLKSGETFKVRYLGMDAPELNGPDYETCFADEATNKNQELILNKKLLLEFDRDKYDRFGRTLAYVYVLNENGEKDIFVNLRLLEEGFSRFFLDEFNDLKQDELLKSAIQSQENYLGLWGACGEDEFSGKCLIKGNISDNGPERYSKFYHLPEDRYYNNTVVNLDKGDKWLCTIEEAEALGFKKTIEP